MFPYRQFVFSCLLLSVGLFVNGCGGNGGNASTSRDSSGANTTQDNSKESEQPIFTWHNISVSPRYSPTGDIKDTTPTFSWIATNNATEYQMGHNSTGLDDWHQYTIPIANANCSNSGDTCSITPSDVVFSIGEQKAWWVRAKINGIWEDWSSAHVFTIIDDSANPPTQSTLDFKIIPMHYGFLKNKPLASNENIGLQSFTLASSARKGDTQLTLSGNNLRPLELIVYLSTSGTRYAAQVKAISGNDVVLMSPLEEDINVGDNLWNLYNDASHPNSAGFKALGDYALNQLKTENLSNKVHAFIGDSWFDNDYLAPYLESKLNATRVINKGLGGRITTDVLDTFDEEFPASATIQPDYFWIILGTNDYWNSMPRETYISNLEKIIKKVNALGAKAFVFTSSVAYGDANSFYNELSHAYADDLLALKLTGGNPPTTNAIPEIIKPSGNITDTTPEFSWSAVTNTSEYQVGHEGDDGIWKQHRVTKDQAGCSGANQTCTSTSTIYTFAIGDQNTWWVRAKVNGSWGEWSTGSLFKVAQQAPPTGNLIPDLIEPSGNISIIRPQFSWTAINSATQYVLGHEESNTGENWNVHTISPTDATCQNARQNCSFTLPVNTFKDGDKINWWVRAKVAGNLKAWSDAKSFTVKR